MTTPNLIIRQSKFNENLVLSQTCENVFFIFLDGRQAFNSLNYDEISDKFSALEKNYTEG